MTDTQPAKPSGIIKKVIKRILYALLIGIGVLVLLGLFVPFGGRIRERGKRTWCNNNLKQLGLAMNLYAADHEEERPSKLSNFIKYVGGDENRKMFMCPSATWELKTPAPVLISQFKDHLDYLSYDLLSATGLVAGPVSATIEPVMCDRPLNHEAEGINILFADGHVTWWPGTLSDYARSNALAITIIPLGVE